MRGPFFVKIFINVKSMLALLDCILKSNFQFANRLKYVNKTH
jgi:hypothetical protein